MILLEKDAHFMLNHIHYSEHRLKEVENMGYHGNCGCGSQRIIVQRRNGCGCGCHTHTHCGCITPNQGCNNYNQVDVAKARCQGAYEECLRQANGTTCVNTNTETNCVNPCIQPRCNCNND